MCSVSIQIHLLCLPQHPTPAKYGDFEELHSKSLATVLYDYNPLENDEIALQKGETIEILSDADSLGWCTGRRNGEVGLFPASYVQVM
ncbi:SH3 domain protein [Cooperia oncophora]